MRSAMAVVGSHQSRRSGDRRGEFAFDPHSCGTRILTPTRGERGILGSPTQVAGPGGARAHRNTLDASIDVGEVSEMRKSKGNPFPLRRARWEDYRDFLEGRLCWIDGSATHRSSGPQRQCPVCRRKWNFVQLQTAFLVLLEFSSGRKSAAAAREIGCARNTVSRHYDLFRQSLLDATPGLLRSGRLPMGNLPPARVRELQSALRPSQPARSRKRACEALLMECLKSRERRQILFESCVLPALRRRIVEARCR